MTDPSDDESVASRWIRLRRDLAIARAELAEARTKKAREAAQDRIDAAEARLRGDHR